MTTTFNPIQERGLFIGGVTVRQDQEGRYFLNDLHKAAGGLKKHSPNYWYENANTKALIEELTNSLILSEAGNPVSDRINNLAPVNMVRGFGERQGTYVVKELVYAYAMWISAAFMLHVIRTFDRAVSEELQAARLELKATVPANKYIALADSYDALQKDHANILQTRPEFGAPRLWTQAEDIRAMDGWLSGLGYTRIGIPLGRTGDSVKHRFKRKLLGLLPGFVAEHAAQYQDSPRAQALLGGGQ